MLRILVFLYFAYFLRWFYLQLKSLRRTDYPRWLHVLEVATHAYLLVGMCLYAASYSPAMVHSWWIYALYVVVALETCLRTMAFRHEERNLDFSEASNNFTIALFLLFVLTTLIPAVWMNYRWALPDSSSMNGMLLLQSAVIGLLVGYLVPRIPPIYSYYNEREMAEWLEASPEFSSRPDKIEWLDSQERFWPGVEEPLTCHLFEISYGDKTYVGLMGPITHCFPHEMTDELDLDQIYVTYEHWHLDNLLTTLIVEPEVVFPGRVRRVIKEALAIRTEEEQ